MKLRSTPVTENPFLVTVVTQTLVATNDQFLRRKSFEGRAEKMVRAADPLEIEGMGIEEAERDVFCLGVSSLATSPKPPPEGVRWLVGLGLPYGARPTI